MILQFATSGTSFERRKFKRDNDHPRNRKTGPGDYLDLPCMTALPILNFSHFSMELKYLSKNFNSVVLTGMEDTYQYVLKYTVPRPKIAIWSWVPKKQKCLSARELVTSIYDLLKRETKTLWCNWVYTYCEYRYWKHPSNIWTWIIKARATSK